ncbi:MAG: hypothetical protein FVQ82_04665 [Planctomycetes bacterium]|nr:hypothetical protein [Planctomycetota bacterium]
MAPKEKTTKKKSASKKSAHKTACTESHAGNVILHLSDLHFLEDPPANRINIENELLLTLEALPVEWKPNIICITGDISDKNNAEGYCKAESWIKLLLEKLNISSENLVICPGNHDLDSEKAGLLPHPKNPEEVEAELIFPIPKKYEEPFTLYTKLCDNLGMLPLENNGNSSHLFGVKDCQGLFFIVSNTCWFWDKDHSSGIIDLPLLEHIENKYNFLKKKQDNLAKAIALMHHPEHCLNWMATARYSNKPSLGFLAQRVGLILTGHGHSLPIGKGEFDSTPTLNCGATFDVTVQNTFGLIRLEEDRFVYQFYKTDSTRAGNRWVKDDEPQYILCDTSQKIVNRYYNNNGSLSSLEKILDGSSLSTITSTAEPEDSTMQIPPELLAPDSDEIAINIDGLMDDAITKLTKAELNIKKLEFAEAFGIIDQVKEDIEPLGITQLSNKLSGIYTRISLIEYTRANCLHIEKGGPADYSVAKEYLMKAKKANGQ